MWSWSGSRLEGSAEGGGQFSVPLYEGVRVHAEGDRGVGVSQATAHRHRVEAGSNGLRGREVAESVEVTVNPGRQCHSLRELAQHVGSDWLCAYRRPAEYEPVGQHLQVKAGGKFVDGQPVPA